MLFVGYVYARAQSLAHVDLDIAVDARGFIVAPPTSGLVYGDCSMTASPAILVGLYIGVDSSNMGIGLAASLLDGIPYIGWSVRTPQLHACCHE